MYKVSSPDSIASALTTTATSFSSSDPEDPFKLTDQTRALGLVVCRGTAVVLICPADSMEAIENPFIQQQDAI